MDLSSCKGRRSAIFMLAVASALLPLAAGAATCKTQSQLTAQQRDALTAISKTLMSEVQSGDVAGMKANTIPAVDFSGIEPTVTALKSPLLGATITVDSLFGLDSSSEAAGSPRTDFFCGSPVVVFNFTDLPPGSYALAIVHATGVPQPQQIGLVLAESANHRWMLGGFFPKPMLDGGHDGLWYWVAARKYAQNNGKWSAWFYYRLAMNSLNPVQFMSTPNLEKLQQEQDAVKPENLPGAQPLMLGGQGSMFQVTSVDTTSALGALDLEVQYTADAQQAAQLRDPPSARKQVTQVMLALLSQHPDLQQAFHGIWVHANQGTNSLFSLELPMDQILQGSSTLSSGAVPR
jgi:hypothetical protein